MDDVAEKFGKFFVARVRDPSIDFFDGGEVAPEIAKRLEDRDDDLGDLIDLIVDHARDVLVSFLTHEDHFLRNSSSGEEIEGKWIPSGWVRAVDDEEFRHEVEGVVGTSRTGCRRRLNQPGRWNREFWMRVIAADNQDGPMAFIRYTIDEIAQVALYWMEPSVRRSFAWSENDGDYVLECCDFMSAYYPGWCETYSRYPPLD